MVDRDSEDEITKCVDFLHKSEPFFHERTVSLRQTVSISALDNVLAIDKRVNARAECRSFEVLFVNENVVTLIL